MADDLKEIIGDKPVVTPPAEEKDQGEDKAKVEQKANLEKAIVEAQETLRKTREEIKKTKAVVPEEEELPQINMQDPSAKAWDKHIKDTTAPLSTELEKAKEEVRTFALRKFLADRPSLARNPDKLKELMGTYDRIKTSSERTQEGVTLDLEKAYAATYYEELISAARQSRIENGRNDALFSEPAVSHGSTAYSSTDKPAPRKYSEEEKAQLAKWGMTPEQHAAMEAAMRKNQ